MKYHKVQMLKYSAYLAIYSVLAICALIALVYVITENIGGKGIFIFIFILAYLGLGIYLNAHGLLKVIDEYKTVRDSGLLQMLRNINPYSSYAEMISAANEERQHAIYEDDEIFITENFLGSDCIPLLLNGILDARVIVHKTNGITEKIELIVLYYDGEKSTFEYRRPFGLSGSKVMNECEKNLEYALNLIAKKSTLFRKYDCARL